MIVFAGPSLINLEGAAFGGVTFRPPARQGDLYLATLETPPAIGLIDGVFEGVPSVWHKEILWALSQGICVFGAASMGALRAAELDVFGMIGIGRIYEAYRDGDLEDDDEVALLHAPEAMGYTALSVAMVNVRATCDAAERDEILTSRQCEKVIEAAKSIFYKDRTWDRICDSITDNDRRGRFRDWLKENSIDQKNRDALALIERMQSGVFTTPKNIAPCEFWFENTDLWHRRVKEWLRTRRSDATSDNGFRLIDNDRLY